MEDNGTIVLDVQMDDLIASLQELKRQYDANTAAMKALAEAGKQDSAEYVQLTQANKVLRQEMSGVEKQIQNEIKAERAQEGSLVQLRAQLANLNKQYDSMSGFDRLGVQGQALQQKIKGLSDQIVRLEGDTGRWQRNVGNYKSALEGLKVGFQGAGLATGGLDNSLKLLNANPIMLLFTAIVTVARAIKNAFKDNEAATMALREAFSAFNPIIDKAKKRLEILANFIAKVVTKTVEYFTRKIQELLDGIQKIGEFFGADWHMGDNFRDAQQAAKDLTKAENDYIKAKREWSVESAKIDREVADLREKAAQKDQYNAEQRLEYMDKAIALETKKAETEKRLAEQNLANLQAEAKRSANSAEMNDKLAEAERAVIEADTALSNTKRALSRQRQSAISEIENETKAVKGYNAEIEQTRDALEEIKMLSMDEYLKETAKGNLELAKSISEVAGRVGELKSTIGEGGLAGLEDLQQKMEDVAETVSDTTKDGPSLLEQWAAAFQDNGKLIEETVSGLESGFGSLSSIYKTMAEDESRSEAEREEAAKKSAMWAKLQIAANSGTAVAKGIASAMDVPFPANLAAIASTLAAVLSAIAQAKALAAEGHYMGGVVGNSFTGATMGPDDTMINARHGELVLNARQQRELFEIANGSGSPSMAAQIAAALAAMPAPVLDYREFTNFTGRVATITESAKIR